MSGITNARPHRDGTRKGSVETGGAMTSGINDERVVPELEWPCGPRDLPEPSDAAGWFAVVPDFWQQ